MGFQSVRWVSANANLGRFFQVRKAVQGTMTAGASAAVGEWHYASMENVPVTSHEAVLGAAHEES